MSVSLPEMMGKETGAATWEGEVCERLTEQIRTCSILRVATASAHDLTTASPLERTLRRACDTIRYNAKWFATEPLADLLATALSAAASSSSSAALSVALTLVDTVGTYALLPPQSLGQIVRFIAMTYYSARRAHKTQKLVAASWETLRGIFFSHLGGECMQRLIDITNADMSGLSHPRDEYAQIVGALAIISDHLLQRDESSVYPPPQLDINELLHNLRSVTATQEANLLEQVMEFLVTLLSKDNVVTALDDCASWSTVLDLFESCMTGSLNARAVQGAISGLEVRLAHFEPRQNPRLAHLFVKAGRPLPPTLGSQLLAVSGVVLDADGATTTAKNLLKDLCESPRYVLELENVAEKAIDELLMLEAEHSTFMLWADTLSEALSAPDTTLAAAKVLSKATVRLFEYCVRHGKPDEVKSALYNALCRMSVRCTSAAALLFNVRADVEGSAYLEWEVPHHGPSAPATALCYLQSLRLEVWDEYFLRAVDIGSGGDWEIFHFYLTNSIPLLANHRIFDHRMGFINSLRAAICTTLASGQYPAIPRNAAVAKVDVTALLVRILTALLSYHPYFSKQDLVSAVSLLLDTAGSREILVSICCIHALAICCHEFPDLMSSYMDDVIDKMSKIVTQRKLAIHVLQFLAGLSRQPELFRNFKTHDYKKIFGVCGNYLQSIRGTDNLNERNHTPSSDNSSSRAQGEQEDALLPFVYALAHHVIAFWYLAIKPAEKQGLKDYIASCLRYSAAGGRPVIEDQGLVTIDLMDRVDADAAGNEQGLEDFTQTDGRVTLRHRLTGLMLITTETALRTAKTRVTVRRPSGTSLRIIEQGASTDLGQHSITLESDHMNFSVFPDDVEGRTYGRIYPPQGDSPLGSSSVVYLPSEEPVRRAIQLFDQTSALDSHKAGVIYVGEGQRTESEILKNVMGSPDYVEFVRGLGTLTRLQGATFNTQGLDRNHDADGKYAVVWHNQVTEVVFHVTTFMPNQEDELLNMASKKRHIGNDHVNIIFNNCGAPFEFNTFPSAFNSVYIVITPSARTSFLQTRDERLMANPAARFYAVQTLTRPGYPATSAAAEEKVLSGASLPEYVRNLALNECVFSTMWAENDRSGEYPSSWRSRLQQLRRLRERYEDR